MARFDADPQLNALGEALAALRREAGLSQAEAGARLGMTSQGWGLYEGGRRPGLFRPDVQRRLTGAIGVTPDALLLRVSPPPIQPPGRSYGVQAGSRPFQHSAGARTIGERDRLTVMDDDLAPWAEVGVTLEFDFDRWPRRGQGCVIDMANGARLVRLYEGADADRLHLRGGPEGLKARSTIERSLTARVAAVIGRHEA